jgi:ribonuclease HI
VKGLYLLHIDGGKKSSASGEAALGAYGFVLRDPKGNDLPDGSRCDVLPKPVFDPHSAEYEALLAGLAFAKQQELKYIAVFSDSRTLVNQINDLWQKSDRLADYYRKARAALKNFPGWQVSWIPREWNKDADELVNKAFASHTPGAEIIHAED